MRYKCCRICEESLPTTSFHKKTGGKYGVDSLCKSCSKKKTYAYRQDQMDPYSKYIISRRSALKSKYGMTLQEYDDLFDKQDGRCAICNEREVQNKLLAVDHDHVTGNIRGLLCSMCNTAIGKLKDDPELLDKAAQYLRANGGSNQI